MSDYEFSKNLSREEFKAIMDSTSIGNRLQDMLVKASEFIVEEGVGIDAIELVGEATRMPYIEDEIKDIFYQ